MKHSMFALTACVLCASVAIAAPASKTPAKAAPAKAVAKSVAMKAPVKVVAKTPKKVEPTVIAQADSTANADEAPGFFPDVPRNHWAFAAVQRLAGAGIVNGYPAAQSPKPATMAAKPDETKVAEKTETAPERVAAVPAEAAPTTDNAK